MSLWESFKKDQKYFLMSTIMILEKIKPLYKCSKFIMEILKVLKSFVEEMK